MKVVIKKVANSTVYFELKDFGVENVVCELRDGIDMKNIPYSTEFSPKDSIEYWVSHPCFICFDKVEMVVRRGNDELKKIILDSLVHQPDHIVNKIGADVYRKIERYSNYSYYEMFKQGQMDAAGFGSLDKKIFKSCKVVVDIGSNLGFFGKYVSQYSYLDKYICVDPNENMNESNREINKNTSYFHKIYNSALHSNDSEKVKFYMPQLHQDYSIGTTDEHFKEEQQGYQLWETQIKDSITLKKIVEDNNIDVIDFLKVDCEGAEKHLLHGVNFEIIKKKVRHLSMEIHSDELKEEFRKILEENEFYIEYENEKHFQVNNDSINKDVRKEKNIVLDHKKILIKVNSTALGDCICATPTIRKVSKSYGYKICVQTYLPHIFQNNPYIEDVYSYDDVVKEETFDEIYTTHNHWVRFSNSSDPDSFGDPVELKLGNYEARQIHALGVGIYLYPEEMEYDYYPMEQTDNSKKINEDFLLFHVTENWESRTWSDENWQRLVNLIKENTDFRIATIGRSHKETTFHGFIEKKVIKLDNIDFNFCFDSKELDYIKDQKDQRYSLSELWHFINNSFAIVSFDSGPIHIAGTTDSNIVCIGSSVRPEKSNPYRNGSQFYKYYYVGGSCNKFCSSDVKYSVKEWGTINSMPYLPNCQEGYDKYYCQPTPEQVFFRICEIKENEMRGKNL